MILIEDGTMCEDKNTKILKPQLNGIIPETNPLPFFFFVLLQAFCKHNLEMNVSCQNVIQVTFSIQQNIFSILACSKKII